MTFGGIFINYYELLRVAEDAPSPVIRETLERYQVSMEEQMNTPATRPAARKAMDEVVPAIEQNLLSSNAARAEYDKQLAEFKRKQAGDYEPADDEGLDDFLDTPFFFNPLDDFDTEIAASTLREIAGKLDREWASACQWITDTSDETHRFVSFLTLVANRKRLADHIEAIFNALTQPVSGRISINEGIERCINILDPGTERPIVSIRNSTFDGKVLDAGSYIPDLPARTELVLGHEGVRGCVFGTIESRTNWAAFGNGQRSVRFAFMPEGTASTIGLSQAKIPLYFNAGELAHNTYHTALIILHLENQIRDIEIPLQVMLYVAPLPPRVTFKPEATKGNPILAEIKRRGQQSSVKVKACNNSCDEQLVPLVARIAPTEKGLTIIPREFHHDETLTITIDTSNQPFGQEYNAALAIEYITPGASGPSEIYVRGAILPTARQSLLREKDLQNRAGSGLIAAFIGLPVLGVLATLVHANIDWLILTLPAIALIFVIAVHWMASATIVHMQRAGNRGADLRHISLWLLRGIPIAIALAVALICALISDASISFLIGAFIGFILGFAFGFMLDETLISSS